ncbi:MAG TPA: hypothetical protein VMB22_06830 [Verrucomicrobiae bacterium]|nr:hypothetical protein [Verrucomicrobiae bacterium]
MKPLYIIFGLGLLFFAGQLFGQDKPPSDLIPFMTELFAPDSQTNMTFIIYDKCPPKYTNVVSNTNLFTPSEQKILEKVLSKYKYVTTNSGPPGTVLVGLDKTNGYYVAHFDYTNLNAHEDITFGDRSAEFRHNRDYHEYIAQFSPYPLARFRTQGGDGYDVIISSDEIIYVQIEHGEVNGLYVDFHGDHCENMLHFIDGKAVNEWLSWGGNEDYILEIKMKSPMDYFRYMTQKIEM